MTSKMSGRREVRSYAYLFSAARMQLELAEGQEAGCFYTSMGCLVFSAFFVEAYVNHAGPKHVPEWPTTRQEERRRYFTPWKKLKLLLSHSQFNQNTSQRPFSSYRRLLGFRDSVAHARTEVLTHSGRLLRSEELWANFPQASWEKLCNPKDARQYFKDAEAIVRALASVLEPGTNPFMVMSTGFYGTRSE